MVELIVQFVTNMQNCMEVYLMNRQGDIHLSLMEDGVQWKENRRDQIESFLYRITTWSTQLYSKWTQRGRTHLRILFPTTRQMQLQGVEATWVRQNVRSVMVQNKTSSMMVMNHQILLIVFVLIWDGIQKIKIDVLNVTELDVNIAIIQALKIMGVRSNGKKILDAEK